MDSNILIGLVILAAIPTYILILRKLKPGAILTKEIQEKKTQKQEPDKEKKEKDTPRKIIRSEKPRKIIRTEKPKKPNSACFHHFGYLSTVPKSASLPDNCLGCSRIVKCLAQTDEKET